MIIGGLAAVVAGTVWPAMAIVFGEVLDVFSRPSNEVLDGTHPWGATFVALGTVAAIAVLIKVSFTFCVCVCTNFVSASQHYMTPGPFSL